MTNNLLPAKKILEEGRYTCVLVKESITYTSTERGVKPLLDWLASNTDLQGFSAADKVIGKAAAFLYALAGVREVYAPVMSEAAIDVLKEYGIKAHHDSVVKGIMNRAKTGMCPMEQAVREVSEPEAALTAIRQRLAAL